MINGVSEWQYSNRSSNASIRSVQKQTASIQWFCCNINGKSSFICFTCLRFWHVLWIGIIETCVYCSTVPNLYIPISKFKFAFILTQIISVHFLLSRNAMETMKQSIEIYTCRKWFSFVQKEQHHHKCMWATSGKCVNSNNGENGQKPINWCK